MSSTGITFSGLASGLDSSAIIRALMSLERRPIGMLEKKQSLYKKSKDLFGQLETKLKELKDAAEKIKLSTNFLDFKTATDNDNKYLSASAGNNAIAGTYDIVVSSLAKSEVRTADARATSTETVATLSQSAMLIFTLGDGTVVNSASISGDASLETMRDAINNGDSGDKLQAQIINTGSGATPYELVITSKVEGTDGTFTVAVDPTGDLDSFVTELNNASNQTVVGTDASLTLNGIGITRSTNKISDLINGVTIQLTGENSGETTKLTISPDGEATGKKIKDFIDKYNEIIEFIEGQSKVDDEGQAGSPLFGDSTLRSIRSSIRGILGQQIETGNTAVSLLSQIGITTDTDGKLTFNQGEFDEALALDEGAVEKLFSLNDKTNSKFGIARQIIDAVKRYTDSVDGLLTTRKKGFDTRIKQADNSIARLERRLDKVEQNLKAKYANLEVLINRLNAQGGALGSLRSAFR